MTHGGALKFWELRCFEDKNCPLRSAEGGDTALRGSVRALEGFSEGKPEAAKPVLKNSSRGSHCTTIQCESLALYLGAV